MSYNITTYKPRGNYKINPFLLNRNKNIRDDFRRMKDEGIRNRDAFFNLAQKYFLSEGTINSIIYARK
ncbi:MAG: hypothetical protein R6W90_15205 [Ignavibacteriaceae bacterium]